eukprot:CAMPEP_0116034256 /NCGR_PEP_ID=MMETSP0321-20121206/19492_1 /TAXON_ID=163516 /ORGANISM="Leptocylindrus danicus var. danicus, Strain B650" /LENGTH=793 /DNA_ID=CAMNT_0003510519 /DNA_START=12 /DNA_END=2389 /DNA_ORIENTATION=-
MAKKQKKGTPETEHADPRFSAALVNPKFRKSGKKTSGSGGDNDDGVATIEIDERFAGVLTDERFSIPGASIDKYGRGKKKKKKKNDGVNEELSAFYRVKRADADATTADANGGDVRKDNSEAAIDDGTEASSSSDESSNVNTESENNVEPEAEDPDARIAYLTALSRGEISGSSSSGESSDESSSDDSGSDSDSSDSEKNELEEGGILVVPDKIAPVTELTNEESPFLAVLNMSWEHVRAVDLLVLLSSFCLPGSVKRVRIFPSDFGLEMMENDALNGPQGIWKMSSKKNGIDEPNEDESSSNDEEDEEDEEDEGSIGEDSENSSVHLPSNGTDEQIESDFNPEKLREYEAMKLKYFFAVAEFAKPEFADVAYREVDGLELEHSSSSLDLRAIPSADIDNILKGREMRDECALVPSNYEPPDFIVKALQLSNVKCTWEEGDYNRESKLTQYGVGNEAWEALQAGDDLKAYLASDNSSDGENSDEEGVDEKNGKGTAMRRLLGLDSDDDGNSVKCDSSDDVTSNIAEDNTESDSESKDAGEQLKEVTFVPKSFDLENKIRSKLQEKDGKKDLTPWEKYLEKRKDKRRERRQAKRNKEKNSDDSDTEMYDESDPVPDWAKEELEGDDFFAEESGGKVEKETSSLRSEHPEDSFEPIKKNKASTKEELDLLLAGDSGEEAAKDFDIRGIMRIEKNKGKKLRGKRKRKEDVKAADVSGTAFKVDVDDDRFKALMDGQDHRFGIDRTDPNFKETPAMRDILREQTKRRKKGNKRKTTAANKGVGSVSAKAEDSSDLSL